MMKIKATGHMNGNSNGGNGSDGGDWEMRPGGMLVQKRIPDSDRIVIPPPTIRVRVKYGSIYHQINVSSQASFGELKKMLAGPTGLHHQDQKLMYKDKERDSKAFLDLVGVKDRSKMVLFEDPISQEKRYLEMRKNAKMEKASKLISEISLEIDRLAGQVSALESVISKGVKVAEKDVLNPTELLMNQLVKLDGIIADGDAKLQRKMQVKRVQKYIETLDVLKIKNSIPTGNGNNPTPIPNEQKYTNGKMPVPIEQKYTNGKMPVPIEQKFTNGKMPIPNEQKYTNGKMSIPFEQLPKRTVSQLPINKQQQQQQQQPSTPRVVVTTKWETFDSIPVSASPNIKPTHQKFNWELFE